MGGVATGISGRGRSQILKISFSSSSNYKQPFNGTVPREKYDVLLHAMLR